MKTSITVINISEIMEISFKGPTYVYRVTSECNALISAMGPYQQANDCIGKLPGTRVYMGLL